MKMAPCIWSGVIHVPRIPNIPKWFKKNKSRSLLYPLNYKCKCALLSLTIRHLFKSVWDPGASGDLEFFRQAVWSHFLFGLSLTF